MLDPLRRWTCVLRARNWKLTSFDQAFFEKLSVIERRPANLQNPTQLSKEGEAGARKNDAPEGK
jgi:hypothetical protein